VLLKKYFQLVPMFCTLIAPLGREEGLRRQVRARLTIDPFCGLDSFWGWQGA
jgi:hypothetical protein